MLRERNHKKFSQIVLGAWTLQQIPDARVCRDGQSGI